MPPLVGGKSQGSILQKLVPGRQFGKRGPVGGTDADAAVGEDAEREGAAGVCSACVLVEFSVSSSELSSSKAVSNLIGAKGGAEVDGDVNCLAPKSRIEGLTAS